MPQTMGPAEGARTAPPRALVPAQLPKNA
jgi:hypothetical protein